MPSWFPIAASVVLAVIPVIIWLGIIIKEGEEKSLYVKTFLLGTLAVVPPFILILIFGKWPELDFYERIKNNVEQAAMAALLTNVVVAIIEEIAKNVIVRVIDKRHPEYIQTLGSALKLSICSGLGFSFAENIFYFYNIWVNFGIAVLFSAFIFRSIFTMCGHMIFSGIFGYYFGIGKFAADIADFARLQGKHMWLTRLLSKITGSMPFQVVREQKNLTGLLMAMVLHSTFNASLDLQHKLPSILIIVVSAVYIAHLLQRKSGALFFSVGRRRGSTMTPKDQDVVMELLGMWTKESRYEEVIKICDRLLLRDPDNNVVKLFKAKANDNQEFRQFYVSLKRYFSKEKLPAAGGAAGAGPQSQDVSHLNIADEKVVLEIMDAWYQEGKYKQVLDVANKLLLKNPNSEGAKLLLQKSIDKEKLHHVFDSLSKLFTE